MKKRVFSILLTICILLLLPGCKDSVMATGRLEICLTSDDYTLTYGSFFERYRQKYPNVELVFDIIPNPEDEEFATAAERVRTQLMSGKGADLYLVNTNSSFLDDISLSMANGAFCDLLPLFENVGISMDDFTEPVMEAGQADGKHYVIPLNYRVPMILTNDVTRDILGDDAFKSSQSMLDGLFRLSQIPGAGTKTGTTVSGMVHSELLPEIFIPYYFASPKIVDYSSMAAEADTQYTKCFLEKSREILDNLQFVNPDRRPWTSQTALNKYISDQRMPNISSFKTTPDNWKEYIKSDKFFILSDYLEYMLYEIGTCASMGLTPNIDPLPGEGGGICARIERFAGIRANSENKLNAANVLAMLLSSEFQSSFFDIGGTDCGRWPVRQGCIEDFASCVVNQGLTPMCSFFTGEVIFDSPVSGEIIKQLIEIESNITSAEFEMPLSASEPIYNYYNGKISIDTALAQMQEYWDRRLWDAG